MRFYRVLFAVLGTVALAGHAVAIEPEAAAPAAAPEAKATQTALLGKVFLERPDPGPPYVGVGKRDPFRPFTLDLRPLSGQQEQLTPLQKYELGQLKVAGIVSGMNPARGMVEDSSGMGYIVTVGTPIGRNEGVVKVIETGRIVVEERTLDFYGQEHLTEVVLAVPSEDGGKN